MATAVERMAGWYASCTRRFRELEPGERAYAIALLVALFVGVVLRLQGQVNNRTGLWQDEALWANHLLGRPMLSHNIRPIAFMWLSRLIVDLFGVTEFWLRFLPNVTSIATLLLAPYVASQLLTTKLARVAFVVLFALHPALIDFSKEFKPYSSEVFVHVGFVALYLRWRETADRKWLLWLLAALPVGFLFAYNLAFAFPGLLLLAAFDGYRRGSYRGALPAVVSGAVCLTLALTVYFTLLTKVRASNAEKRWGSKYDIFYQPPKKSAANAPLAPSASALSVAAKAPDGGDSSKSGEAGDTGAPAGAAAPRDEALPAEPEANGVAPASSVAAPAPSKPTPASANVGRLTWLLGKYADVAALPGLRRSMWMAPPALGFLAAVDYWLFVLLHLAGLVALITKRRHAELLLFVMPLLVVVGCNLAGLWPMGAFRSNLFLCVPAIAIASLGIDSIAALGAAAALPLAGVLVSVSLLPGLAFGTDWQGHKRMWTRDSYARVLVTKLRDLREQELKGGRRSSRRIVVLTDLATLEPLTFYINHHETLSAGHGEFFDKQIKIQRMNRFLDTLPRELDRRLAGGAKAPPVIVVASKNIPEVQAILHAKTRILHEEIVRGQHLLAVVASPSYQKPWPQ